MEISEKQIAKVSDRIVMISTDIDILTTEIASSLANSIMIGMENDNTVNVSYKLADRENEIHLIHLLNRKSIVKRNFNFYSKFVKTIPKEIKKYKKVVVYSGGLRSAVQLKKVIEEKDRDCDGNILVLNVNINGNSDNISVQESEKMKFKQFNIKTSLYMFDPNNLPTFFTIYASYYGDRIYVHSDIIDEFNDRLPKFFDKDIKYFDLVGNMSLNKIGDFLGKEAIKEIEPCISRAQVKKRTEKKVELSRCGICDSCIELAMLYKKFGLSIQDSFENNPFEDKEKRRWYVKMINDEVKDDKLYNSLKIYPEDMKLLEDILNGKYEIVKDDFELEEKQKKGSRKQA